MPAQPKTPTFIDAAAFFEAKARKERSPERRAQFADAVKFYRAMLPVEYKAQHRNSGRSNDVMQLRIRAEECRAIAASIRDRRSREVLARVARRYEELARKFEK